MLTKRQHELLSFLVSYQKDNVRSPSYEEMRQALDLQSKSAIHALVEGLVKRKYCKRIPNRARALKILKTPEDEVAALGSVSAPAGPSDTWSIPFFGAITSTASVDVFLKPSAPLNVVKASLPKGVDNPDSLMAMNIQGDFLREWGVLSGDMLVFQKTDAPVEAGIMLVSVEDKLMLRKWTNEGGRITLRTANRYLIPETHHMDEIRIHGKLVYLTRRVG